MSNVLQYDDPNDIYFITTLIELFHHVEQCWYCSYSQYNPEYQRSMNKKEEEEERKWKNNTPTTMTEKKEK